MSGLLRAAVLAAVTLIMATGAVITAAGATEAPLPTTSPSATVPSYNGPKRAAAALSRLRLVERRWNKARACFRLPALRRPRPARPASADEAEWRAYVSALCALRADVRARAARLIKRMDHPKGSGARRWLPLARWVGWPRAQEARLVRVITRESHGRPGADSNPPYFGLMQIWSAHVSRWAPSPRVLLRARTNLTVGLWLWRANGWGPWSATAY